MCEECCMFILKHGMSPDDGFEQLMTQFNRLLGEQCDYESLTCFDYEPSTQMFTIEMDFRDHDRKHVDEPGRVSIEVSSIDLIKNDADLYGLIRREYKRLTEENRQKRERKKEQDRKRYERAERERELKQLAELKAKYEGESYESRSK